jgi:hypothetical protein
MQTFIECNTKLQKSRYLSEVISGKNKVTFHWSRETEIAKTTRNLPDEEATDALVLTLRLLIQDNDEVSFGSMAKLVHEDGISKAWKDRFSATRKELNDHLRDSSMFAEKRGKNSTLVPYTSREVFETFLYGAMAHRQSEKQKRYKRWSKRPDFVLLESIFTNVAVNLLNASNVVAKLCELELAGKKIPTL